MSGTPIEGQQWTKVVDVCRARPRGVVLSTARIEVLTTRPGLPRNSYVFLPYMFFFFGLAVIMGG